MKRRLALQWLLGGALTPAMVRAQGASGYPDRPVNLVIPFPPGGLADSVARMLIPSLEEALGKTVIAVNKAGAAGAVGTASVVNARADGYNLLFTLSSISTLPEQAHVNHQKPPFLLNQLTPIARITTDPMAVVTYEDSRYKDLKQLINDARARPGMVSYGSSGIYGAVHVPAEMFAQSAGIRLNHIPYTGGAPLIQALLGRQVDMTVLPRSSILPYLHAGKVRALAVLATSAGRNCRMCPACRTLGWTSAMCPGPVCWPRQTCRKRS